MPIALLTSKGQMTIPKEVRKALGLKPAGKVIIVVGGDLPPRTRPCLLLV
jgi:AbrB family looped-hinge helix DNA binding protein